MLVYRHTGIIISLVHLDEYRNTLRKCKRRATQAPARAVEMPPSSCGNAFLHACSRLATQALSKTS